MHTGISVGIEEAIILWKGNMSEIFTYFLTLSVWQHVGMPIIGIYDALGKLQRLEDLTYFS